MADILTPGQRSRCMAAIHSSNTSPELLLRHLLHSLGYRYRVNYAVLPGKPDLVFPTRRKVIFIHGCFWHRHHCRAGMSNPATRKAFWTAKLAENKRRDIRQVRELRMSGWAVMIVWQCQLKKSRMRWTVDRITHFLEAQVSEPSRRLLRPAPRADSVKARA